MENIHSDIFKKKLIVSSFDTDINLKLRVHTLFQWFSEIAWQHVKIMEYGFEELKRTDLFWVLIGMNVKIHKLPIWQDELEMHSWHSGSSGIYFCRDFILYDKDNEILAEADSKWLIYDKDKQRPIIHKEKEYEELTFEHPITNYEYTKLIPHNNLSKKNSIMAEYTDIDMHKHVNNAVYIKWIENYLGDITPMKISNVSVQYLKQIKYRDSVDIYFNYDIEADNHKLFCEAILQNEDKVCFRAELELI
jgi:acyl-ACP thioesterase